MRTRREARKPWGSRDARAEPLEEPIRPGKAIRLFETVDDFAFEKSRERARLERQQRQIQKAYSGFTQQERVCFFSMLYDRFADRYDEHMGVETRHYQAIRRVLGYATPYLKFPILDITAGTGEPLTYALEMIERAIASHEFEGPVKREAFANEISPRMLGKARRKLGGAAGFSSHDAYGLPKKFAGRFSTVLCAQTFHLIPDSDKVRLVRSIHRALAPGGTAVVVEEDPFRISQTPPIEAVSLFLRAIVRPIKPDMIIGKFESLGFEHNGETAVSPIDSDHSMHLHLFQKVTSI